MTRPTVVSMYCLLELDRLGVHDVLVVVRVHQVDDFAGVAQPDRA